MIQSIADSFSRWTCAAALVAIVAAGTVSATPALADEQRWGFGSDLGLTSGTVNGTVFTMALSADYYLDRNFSIGPMMQLSPVCDLFQVSFAGVSRYHFRLKNGINLVPFTGIGLIHADLDREPARPASTATTQVGISPSASQSNIRRPITSRCPQP